MNRTYLAIFLVSLVLPFIYWRTLFAVAKRVFDKPALREKSGLQIHHLHYGALFILVAAEILLISGQSAVMWIFFGLGLGLVMDEMIPSLLMPGNRPVELEVYSKGFKSTLVLFAAILLVTGGLFLIFLRF